MRISDTQINNVMLNGMNEGNKELTTLLVQLQTGEKLTKLSDDPVATVKLIGLEKTLNKADQYISNIDLIKSDYQRYETQIGSIENNLQDANELILLAKNDTTDSTSYLIELEALKESMVASFNAKDNDGHYMFSGTASDEAPFIKYAGTDEWVINPNINSDNNTAVIGDDRKIASNFLLQDVDAENILQFMNSTIAELDKESPDMEFIGAAHDQLISSLDLVLASNAKLGSGINNMDRLQEAHLDTELFANKLEGDLKNLSYDEAAVMLDSYMLALEASQKTFSKLSGLSLFNQI